MSTTLKIAIGIMHTIYGYVPDLTCGQCAHLTRRGRYFRCDLTRITRSQTADWRQSWPACGKFAEIKENE